MNEIKWTINQAHSELSFKVQHSTSEEIKGIFKTFDASIYTTGNDFTTVQFELWIDASSIDTGDVKRDQHLISAEFFDVQHHKQISFTSGSMEKLTGDDHYELWGNLTIRGITRNVKFDAQFREINRNPRDNEIAGFTIAGTINRIDWGLLWNKSKETGGMMVDDEVTISCKVELTNIGHKRELMSLIPPTKKIKPHLWNLVE